MQNTKAYRYTFYVLLAIVAIGTLYAYIVMPLQDGSHRANSQSTSSSEHDKTNSDNHHSSDSKNMGKMVDLTSQSKVSMDIKNYKYSQPNIKIKKGTTVTWTNQDSVRHNVMMDHNDSVTAHDAPSQNEVKDDVLAGPLLARGESYSFTFNEVSTDPYHCSPHPYMKGSVTVVE